MKKGSNVYTTKKDFFIRQNEISRFAEWVENGTFQYTYIDGEGEEHIVGYSFTNEFVCDYSSFMKGSLSLVNIQAITDCSVYEISRHDIIEYWETDMETQRFGRCMWPRVYMKWYMDDCSIRIARPEIRYRRLDGALSQPQRSSSFEKHRFILRGYTGNH